MRQTPPTATSACADPGTPYTALTQECKISGGAGFTNKYVYGGNPRIVPLSTVSVGYEP